MKKDILIAVIAIVVIVAICFGLGTMRPPFRPTPSEPFTAKPGATGLPSPIASNVVMRVNGEPITEEEFRIIFEQMPEQQQRQFASEQGKQAVAERIVRMKLLEQEGRRQGLDKDPHVAAQIALGKTNVLAEAAFTRLAPAPTDAQVQQFYNENKAKLETIDLSHILIAYRGGQAPPRDNTPPLPQELAMQKAQAIYEKVKQGGDFAAAARQYSDDTGSAQQGGSLGPVGRGLLPPELDKVVFDLPAGQVSAPVPSRYGIHIFKVTRKSAQPLAEVKAELAQKVGQKEALTRIEALRKGAKVEFDSKFFPNAKAWQDAQTPVKKPS